jgi:hypothetical protein
MMYYAEIEIKISSVCTFKTKTEESRDDHRDAIDGGMYLDYFVHSNLEVSGLLECDLPSPARNLSSLIK